MKRKPKSQEFGGLTFMQLNPDTDKALNGWLGPQTWYKNHPFDMDRFYKFVDQYAQDHGYTIDETALREEIEHRVTKYGGRVGEELRDIIRSRISLAYDILRFLEVTGR
ncbi:MAG TPA: hypothetical protein VE732_04465 [Nitrososphaera sp.]|nr:hypothetical protein [Nitrososphaera sp.]